MRQIIASNPLESCSSLLYAFCVLHTHGLGLPSVSLQDVFGRRSLQKSSRPTVRLRGPTAARQRIGPGLDGFLKQCKRRGFCETSITEIFDDTDNIFFVGILQNSKHVLQTFLSARNLRQRAHNKIISKTVDLNDHDFIARMLYKDSYYFLLQCEFFLHTACFYSFFIFYFLNCNLLFSCI